MVPYLCYCTSLIYSMLSSVNNRGDENEIKNHSNWINSSYYFLCYFRQILLKALYIFFNIILLYLKWVVVQVLAKL